MNMNHRCSEFFLSHQITKISAVFFLRLCYVLVAYGLNLASKSGYIISSSSPLEKCILSDGLSDIILLSFPVNASERSVERERERERDRDRDRQEQLVEVKLSCRCLALYFLLPTAVASRDSRLPCLRSQLTDNPGSLFVVQEIHTYLPGCVVLCSNWL